MCHCLNVDRDRVLRAFSKKGRGCADERTLGEQLEAILHLLREKSRIGDLNGRYDYECKRQKSACLAKKLATESGNSENFFARIVRENLSLISLSPSSVHLPPPTESETTVEIGPRIYVVVLQR